MNGHDIGIVGENGKSDGINHRQHHSQLQNRAGAASHYRLNGHTGCLFIIEKRGHFGFHCFILIAQQFQRGFLRVLLGIVDEQKANLVQENERGAFYGKANKIRQKRNKHHDHRDREVVPFFDGIHGLQNNVISGGHSRKHKQNDAQKFRHFNNKRDGKDDRGHNKADNDHRIVVWRTVLRLFLYSLMLVFFRLLTHFATSCIYIAGEHCPLPCP